MLVFALAVATTSPSTASRTLRIRGADISFTLQEEAINQPVSDNGREAPVEQILKDNGANFVRLRLWVNPLRGTSDLNSALTLARRAQAAGLRLLVDFHYSDTWADRTSQQPPAAWQGMSYGELLSTVESYTRESVAAFAKQGTPADIVQIGNEVTRGMLWPYGQVTLPDDENWVGLAGLINAGANGARAGNPGRHPLIMVHSDTGGDRDASIHFYDQLQRHGVGFDLIGLTYYPFWNGSLADLERNLRDLAYRFGKDIIIAETAYPWTLSSSGGAPSVVSTMQALPDAAQYPPTPHGQAKFFAALNRVLREVPDGRGAGYFIWEPGWLPGVGADAAKGNTHNNLTLFDWQGQGLPALDAFKPTGTDG
ncbi:glycosyl hydrolase 53 family protein [Arthrobacter sp. B3I9]|uniref:glycoside hydrolase family 53 protein n=1 Tax=Arthrobacter sp. B3I9 TaxID=3042270 RepID=UPI0027D8D58B|nr:glycosyl hydrolase 53 family protein [Arthrobacter sp. B3I9]